MSANLVCEGWLELARAWCELRDSKDHPDAGDGARPALASTRDGSGRALTTTATNSQT